MEQIFQKSSVKSFLSIGALLLSVFVLASFVWYSPVLFKGYAAYTTNVNVLIGRNLSKTGIPSIESDLNVFLSSASVRDRGHISAGGNKLTPILYSKIFDLIDFVGINNLVLLSVFIHALTLVIFTGIVFYLFDLKTSLAFSLIYIFLPFNWQQPYGLGNYEFALFFLSLFFLFYFYGIKQEHRQAYLVISGAFLALACFSKEALFLIVPFLCAYLWFGKKKIILIYILTSFMLLFAFFWLPGIGQNAYIQFFTTQTSEELKSANFNFYGHIYPDPYTYHFEKEEFINGLREKRESGRLAAVEELGEIKVLNNMGIRGISLVERFKVGLMICSRHIFRFVSLEGVGGPFIFLLIVLGAYILRRKDKYLYHFFIYWIFSAIFLMAFVVPTVRNHLMDFNWAIALLITLGALTLGGIVADYFNLKGKLIIRAVILLVVLYNFVLANHVVWGRTYDDSSSLTLEAYSREIGRLNISDNDVIAIGLGSGEAYSLNYLADKSVVLFKPETVRNLLEKDELRFAFEKFGVRYILGYSDELTGRIVNQTNVINVASSSLKPAVPEMSRNKGWLMNLIK